MTDAPVTPPASVALSRQERAAQARTFLARLAEQYPACFTRDPNQIRPLAIGIQQKLRAELAQLPEFESPPGWLVRQSLALYTRSIAYLTAIVEKRPRINLDGSTASKVTDQEQEHARQQLEEIKARIASRRAANKKRRARPAPRRLSAEEKTQRKLEQLAAKYSRK